MFSLCLVGILWDAIFIPYNISQWNPLLLSKGEGKETAKRDMSPGLHKKTIHCWAMYMIEWRHINAAFCLSPTQLLRFSDTSHVGRMKSNVAKGSSTLNRWKCVAFCLLGKLDCIESGAVAHWIARKSPWRLSPGLYQSTGNKGILILAQNSQGSGECTAAAEYSSNFGIRAGKEKMSAERAGKISDRSFTLWFTCACVSEGTGGGGGGGGESWE